MARKSAALRLQQASDLAQAYSKAGLSGDRNFRFISDMITRITRSRGLTTKQRNWLDALIEEGVPKPKGDLALIERMEQALAVPGAEGMRDTLTDFLRRERNGWSLSPKQIAFRDRLLAEAEDIAANGPWKPSEEQARDLESCSKLARARSQMYWSTHPGEHRACQAVEAWQAGDRDNIDKWSVEKVLHSFRVGLRELANPYADPGTLIWTRVRSDTPGSSRYHYDTEVVPALVSGPPTVSDRGTVVYPALADGQFLQLTAKQLMKRKPKDA
jgi:hypothetical protein